MNEWLKSNSELAAHHKFCSKIMLRDFFIKMYLNINHGSLAIMTKYA